MYTLGFATHIRECTPSFYNGGGYLEQQGKLMILAAYGAAPSSTSTFLGIGEDAASLRIWSSLANSDLKLDMD